MPRKNRPKVGTGKRYERFRCPCCGLFVAASRFNKGVKYGHKMELLIQTSEGRGKLYFRRRSLSQEELQTLLLCISTAKTRLEAELAANAKHPAAVTVEMLTAVHRQIEGLQITMQPTRIAPTVHATIKPKVHRL